MTAISSLHTAKAERPASPPVSSRTPFTANVTVEPGSVRELIKTIYYTYILSVVVVAPLTVKPKHLGGVFVCA